MGEFVFDWSWADAARRAGIDYFPKLVAAVPFSPVSGQRLLVSPEAAEPHAVRCALVEAALGLADELQLSSVHFNFVSPDELSVFQELDLPLRHGIQYHWYNGPTTSNESPLDTASKPSEPYRDWNDFLARFRSKKRANIKRERRKLVEAGVTTRVLQGPEIDERLLQRIYAYYVDTVDKFYYGRRYLNQDFFLQLGERLRPYLHVVVAERDEQEFAGAFNLYKDGRLYGRYWGCKQEVDFAHFEVCFYKSIEWGIEHQITAFEPGAGGEHKFERGFEPTLTYSAHYLRDPRLERAIKEFLEHERRAVRAEVMRLRSESPLKA